MKSRKCLPLLSLLLLPVGCKTEMMERLDEAEAFENEAVTLERREQYPAAAKSYAQSEEKLALALENAKERNVEVFVSFITAKLSSVSAGQGRCIQPNLNAKGSWKKAREHFARSGEYAVSVTLPGNGTQCLAESSILFATGPRPPRLLGRSRQTLRQSCPALEENGAGTKKKEKT